MVPPPPVTDVHIQPWEEIAGETLFGTDWPSPGVRSIGEDLPLSDEAKDAIHWRTAATLFGPRGAP